MPTFSEDTAGAQARPASPGEALHNLQDGAKDLLDTAREHGTEQFGSYRDSAAEQIENLAKTASAAAEDLQDKDTLGISHYISDIAESLSAFATSMRGKSAEEMLQQAGRLARENPALFVTGSVAVGFGLSRFLRASSPDLTGSNASTSSSAPDSPQYPAGEHESSFKAGEDEGLNARHPYEGDTARGAPIQTPDPLAPHDPTAKGSATTDLDDGSGIQQSGAELGSFNADPGTASSPAPSSTPAPDKPAPRGEF